MYCWEFVSGTENQLVSAASVVTLGLFPPWAAQSVLVMPSEPRVASFRPAVEEDLGASSGDILGAEGRVGSEAAR